MSQNKNSVIGKYLSSLFSEGQRRELTGPDLMIFSALALGLSVYQIWSLIWGKLDPINQMAIHLSLILMLTFLIYGFSVKMSDSIAFKLVDYIAVILAGSAGVYYTLRSDWIANRNPYIDTLTSTDVFFGLILVVLSLEATRRTIGFPIVAVVFAFLAYSIWGHNIGGVWGHRELSAVYILDQLAFSYNGLWSSPIAVAASFVFMFVLFGCFLQSSGAGHFFFEISSAVAGRSRGGQAKVAIIASALFGTISGSPTANVVTTGSFTIPMAKKTGYKPSFAAAVEAVASTGGSILPPIMGSSAFLMAAITGINYSAIVIAALIPAVLFYVSLYGMVHFEAVRLNLKGMNKEDLPDVKETLKKGWYYSIPLIVLTYLLIDGFSPSRTGFYGILTIIAISWFRKETRMGPRRIIEALIDGGKSAIPVTTACAAAGMVISGIMSTGLGGKLTSIILGLTEGMLFPTLILVMVICIILGMGMPVAAAYVLTAMLAAPVLMEMGVSQMGSHLFIVYFSIISAITPPVAVAAFAAAGIAGANPNRVGFEAVRLGIAGFIVPFMFIYSPGMLMEGSLIEIAYALITGTIGVLALGAGIIGYLFVKSNVIERILLILCGLGLIHHGLMTSLIGITLFIVIFFLQFRKSKLALTSSSNGSTAI